MPLHMPTWSQTKTTSKQGFDKVYKVVDKLGNPVNKLSNKLGSEAFWPTTLDRESDKAARILRSFCKDGFYVDDSKDRLPAGGSPKGKARVVKKIPTEVIRKAKGLAIFTTMRTGLWVSGAGGSGVLVARTATGEWSPPSGIMLHTAGLGFLIGVDIYDCVVVINTEKALEAFTKIRCTLGGEVSAVAGPVGVGGVLETELHKRQAPVWNYLKSRGFYAGVQIDGTVIIERTDENERFYGQRIGVADILAGKARHAPYETRTLMATLKAAQGDVDVDEEALPAPEPTPGDLRIEVVERSNSFGLPAEDDPDPFGVLALQKEGLEIREAGTNSRPSMEAFEYKPSPTSPIYSSFGRHSLDGAHKHDSKRSSKHSIASIDRGTQTDAFEPASPEELTRDAGHYSPVMKTSENLAAGTDSEGSEHDRTVREPIIAIPETDESVPKPVISRARLVTIPKRIPPALPPRSPYRNQPSVLTSTDALSDPTEREPRGLGVDLHHSLPQETPADHDRYGEGFSPTREDIDRKLDIMHLSPRAEISDPINHPDRLSPRKDGFDEVSMSGSDYSHETLTVTDEHQPSEATTAQVRRIEHEELPGKFPSEATTAQARRIENEELPGKFPSEATTAQIRRIEHEELPGKFEEFHSVPSTPLEPHASASFPPQNAVH
ncbi:hypothetical protein MMC07_007874 [Pseudocyphellaria aurata]|nr:hypothetical protein [Pseudocyphellaria aurata]